MQHPIGSEVARKRGFTLVELLVVIGIIALLIGMLMPALGRARDQANGVKCKANLKNCAAILQLYANDYNGWVYPIGAYYKSNGGKWQWDTLGTKINTMYPPAPCVPTTRPIEQRWPYVVFHEPYPKILLCPSDTNDGPDPVWYSYHSYLLNKYIADSQYKVVKVFGRTDNMMASQILVMGEKLSTSADYYMEGEPGKTEWDNTVETARHGTRIGSNYLYLDWHVDTLAPAQIEGAADPWDTDQTAPTTQP